MTADLRRLVKKLRRCSNYPSLYCTRGKELTKKQKRNVYAVRVTFHPMRSAYSPKPLVTPLCMWGPKGDVIIHAQFQLNRFRG